MDSEPFNNSGGPFDTAPDPAPSPGPDQAQQRRRRRRHYKPRTCRICLESVQPTFLDDPSGPVTGLFTGAAKVKYISDDPELGRLICPCKCKGSQKFVHEGCLQAWRAAAPLSDRNFWMCPTCRFKYRVERIKWAQWLSSWVTRGFLTVAILLLAVFILGFVADPILNLWLDPIAIVTETLTEGDTDGLFSSDLASEPATWSFHLLKGFFSLGLLGFMKSMFAMGPFQWFQIRFGGVRRRGNGRDRLDNINYAYILLGVITVLGATWKLISKFSAHALERASEHVMEVQDADSEDEPDESEESDLPEDTRRPQESRKDI